MRLYLFGEAEQGTALPNADASRALELAALEAESLNSNYIGQEHILLALLRQDTGAVAEALRDAIEPNAHITSWRGDSRDTETKLYRYSFDLTWWVNR